MTKINKNHALPPESIVGGRYLILNFVSEGGGYITYRAYDLVEKKQIRLREYFPIKFLSRDGASGKETVRVRPGAETIFAEKLEREMQAADVEDCVGIHDHGTFYLIEPWHRFRRPVAAAVLCAAAIILGIGMAVYVLRSASGPDASDQVISCEVSECILYADSYLLTTGEETEVTFTVESDSGEEEDFDLYLNDAKKGDFTLIEDDEGRRTYELKFPLNRSQPEILVFTAKSQKSASQSLEVRIAPEITEEMVQTLTDVAADIDEQERKAYPNSAPDVNFVDTVAQTLEADPRIEHVARTDEEHVFYVTNDGLGGVYMLPVEEGMRGGRDYRTYETEDVESLQENGFTEAVEQGWDLSSYYVYNSYALTSNRVLLAQLSDEMPISDSMKEFARQLASGIGATMDLRQEDAFLGWMLDGLWCDYGSIILDTHGGLLTKRENGEDRLYFQASFATGDAAKKIAAQYFYAYYDSGKNLDNPTRSLIYMCSDGSICFSTDVVMNEYGNRRFDNTVFYMNVCYGLGDYTFNRFLLEHGARAMIGSTETIGVNPMKEVNFASSSAHNWYNFWKQYLRVITDGDYETGKLYRRGPSLWKAFEVGNNTYYLGQEKNEGFLMVCRDPEAEHFRYVGSEKAKGIVNQDEKPVAGATVTAYRYMNHELVEKESVTTGKDGVFSFENMLETGTYIFRAEYQGVSASAMTNLTGNGLNYGIIELTGGTGDLIPESPESSEPTKKAWDIETSNSAKTTIVADETMEPESTVDPAEILLQYLKNDLVASYGVMSVTPWKLSESLFIWECGDNSLMNGILSAWIADLDTDGQKELITVRFTPGENAEMILEVYEVESGTELVSLASRMSFDASKLCRDSINSRLAVFFTEADGSPKLYVYGFERGNGGGDESIRQLFYADGMLQSDHYWRISMGSDLSVWAQRGIVVSSENGNPIIMDLARDNPAMTEEETQSANFDSAERGEVLNAFYENLEEVTGLRHAKVLPHWTGTSSYGPPGYATCGELDRDSIFLVKELFVNADAVTWMAELDDCFYYSWDDQGRFSHSNIMTPRDDTGLVH